MLLRGANAVGYSNYPDNLIRAFVKGGCAVRHRRIPRVRLLNWIPGMEIAMDEVLKQGKLCRGHHVLHRRHSGSAHDRYTLEYYVNMAKELEKRGAHLLAIKDMSGLLKPYAAKKLISTLKQEVGLPIHLHTHDTSGNQVAAYLMAAEAGVDIVDCAIDSMSSTTSQPSLNAVVAALEGTERDTGLELTELQKLTDYWADVRLRYEHFDHGLKSPVTDIYRYEMPGGQYTNLQPQVISLGLGTASTRSRRCTSRSMTCWAASSKGDPLLQDGGRYGHLHGTERPDPREYLHQGQGSQLPRLRCVLLQRHDGPARLGLPRSAAEDRAQGRKPITCRPGELLPPADFDKAWKEVSAFCPKTDMKQVIAYCFYPKVVKEFWEHAKEYGYLMRMGSHVFFNGMALGETNKINIEDGKTLVIKYIGLGELDDEGNRVVEFELNGMRREVSVPDPSAADSVKQVTLADPEDKSQIGASIPGLVSKINVKVGDTVEENQVIAVIEAMKMETSVTARMAGKVKSILVSEGSTVKAGELLITVE